FEQVSWSKAVTEVASRFQAIKARDGKIGIVGSTHTTNEENYVLQKMARAGLGTNHIDHHRSGDVAALLDALGDRTGALATTADLYNSRAILVVASDLAQQHPLLAYQIRANWRHHVSHTYTVTPGPVREDGFAVRSVRVPVGEEIADIESLRGLLKNEPELVILFSDAVKGETVRQLVAFGDSLGIPVKYVCLVDYSNSRGAMDMGLRPDLLPGYQSVAEAGLTPGMTLPEMLAAPDLDALWVVGANPLKSRSLASASTFVVVQDLFLTETAQRADVVFPAASTYEKSGTVTNVCGEVQHFVKALEVMGTKPDLEIFGLLAKEMGLGFEIGAADAVFEEIRGAVRGYNIALPVAGTGGAVQTKPGRGPIGLDPQPDLVHSAGDTLFTSGSLGRYCKTLNSVTERTGALYGGSKVQTSSR
ncbi:MAG: molybdopterin-dependent oxidoreductase, partial [Bryobacteraceae bacterium]